MNPPANNSVDWSEYKRCKRNAILATILVPVGLVFLIFIFGSTKFIEYLIFPIGSALIIVDFIFLRKLQVLTCPKCGGNFMDQSENMIIIRAATWHILFRSDCISCGANRWLK